ncbi:TrmH family RNA methyltransferase [Carboxydochorda subterranea]|uniref:TrmH family RNA methyltransferase n=1 Tax=Carboxydichorda subterranea TaxID=3109565 RepID=A0ABZ1BWJ2_9FIRM|nr:TrmH family RNA methyltransferase [Limnochorda sp. L945t]WRP17172.1 TrmH family RNA methyltransferase [Limnochorda sp. L945t]
MEEREKAVPQSAATRGRGLLDNVVVVLYQPEDLVNVASVVRLMTNFEVTGLRLVEPAAWDPWRIEAIAHGGQEVLAAARRFATLEEALADCSLVLATTGRPRELVRERLTPRQAARALLQAASANPGAPAAVLFGRERDGLPNSVIDRAHALVTIPTDPGHHSLNLSHAAGIVLYELYVAWCEEARPERTRAETGHPMAVPVDRPIAPGSQRAEMVGAIEELLETLHPHTSPARRAAALSRLEALLLRAVPDPHEVELLINLFRHMTRIARAAGQAPRR